MENKRNLNRDFTLGLYQSAAQGKEKLAHYWCVVTNIKRKTEERTAIKKHLFAFFLMFNTMKQDFKNGELICQYLPQIDVTT